ncbi:hypothetical protein [Nocardioides pacificus]
MSTKVPMRVEAIFAIREARGLNGNQKSLLYTVESRGVSFAKWHTIAADAGLGRDAFYKAKGQLVASGLLVEQRRWNDTTNYRVDLPSLERLASPGGSGNPESTRDDVPGIRQTIPGIRKASSGNPESKETPKKTSKETTPPEAAAEAEVEKVPQEIRALIAIAPSFDDDGDRPAASPRTPGLPQDTAAVEAALAASRPQVIASDPFRSSPPRQPHPKDPIYSRNSIEREGREQGYDPITGEYAEHRPIPRSRRR